MKSRPSFKLPVLGHFLYGEFQVLFYFITNKSKFMGSTQHFAVVTIVVKIAT